jgi:acetoin utilization protein AcuC
VREIKSWGFKWVALGGGGYNVMNVARAWTSSWAIMKGSEVPNALPEDFVRKHKAELGQQLTLSDPPQQINGTIADDARKLATSVVAKVKENIFPLNRVTENR